MLKPGARGLVRGPGQAAGRWPGVGPLPPGSSSLLSHLYRCDPAMKMRSEKVGLNSWLFSPLSQGKGGRLAGRREQRQV